MLAVKWTKQGARLLARFQLRVKGIKQYFLSSAYGTQYSLCQDHEKSGLHAHNQFQVYTVQITLCKSDHLFAQLGVVMSGEAEYNRDGNGIRGFNYSTQIK